MKITLVAVFLAVQTITYSATTSNTVVTAGGGGGTTAGPYLHSNSRPTIIRIPTADLETCRRLRSELQVASNLHLAACDVE
jgi:hypothetical protein